MGERSRSPVGAGGLLLAAVLSMPQLDCDTPTGPPPPPAAKTVIEETWALAAGDAIAVDYTVTGFGSGDAAATVDWTFATDDVDLFITATQCTPEMFSASQCAFKSKADSALAKPERLAFKVSAGDSYRFWIVNFGPAQESGTFTLRLTQ